MGGMWQYSMVLLDSMDSRSVESDTTCQTAAISACEKGGWWQHALALLDTLDTVRVGSYTITYSVVISACETDGM